MRISKEKSVRTAPVMPLQVLPSVAARKKELAAAVQAALRIGADLSAREAGRRAFSEFLKLEAVSKDGVCAPGSEQILFTYPTKRRERVSQ